MALGDGVSALASLTLTFGGFAPTAMDGVAATRELLEQYEKSQAEKKEAQARRRAIEMARASAPKRFTDENGITWTYVVLNESFVRIEKVKRETEFMRIPDELDGMPVKALGSDIFGESEIVREIVCADGIESIGSCAFRLCKNLKRVVFPKGLSSYSASWLQHCESIEEIVLPGMLDSLSAAVFDNPSLRKLHIGSALYEVKPGACEKTQLDEITVDAANPFIATDGDALYSIDESVFVALIRPVRHYCVHANCKMIAKKACNGIASLEEVELPEGLEIIGEFAFAHTGLRTVSLPSTVTTLKSKAFFYCDALESVELNEGLKTIEDSVFSDSGLKSLFIPASIEQIGTSVTARSNVVHSGPDATFAISPESKTLHFDGMGGLYRRQDDGMHFIQLIDSEETSYRVCDGTIRIDDYAFAFHDAIEEVELSEGVIEIGRSAFRVCGNLRKVHIPNSLVTIGKEAFFDTNLEEIRIPAALKDLGEDALVTAGAHRYGEPPSLRVIEVDEGNERYYVESGLLCYRDDDGDSGIVFNDDVAHVVIPDSVAFIAAYAFSNARNIKSISIGPNLALISTCGLSTWSSIENIHIELAEPVEGRTVFDVKFPDTPRAIHEISLSLGGSSWVNVPEIIRHYDNCLTNAHDYNARNSDGISAYEQVKLMMGRFKDPILLTQVNRSMFERMIREHLEEICVDVARHDDRSVIDDLCEFGYLNSDNLEGVIVAVGRLQDAAMTGYLLELKRQRFGRAAFDFDL